MNAVCAVEAAKGTCAEVLVCMHETESDDRCALHRGTRVRKNHTSRRDAFETIGRSPLGVVDYDTTEITFRREYEKRGETELDLDDDLSEAVELLKFVPGEDLTYLSESLQSRDLDGLVIEGTGLGHVHSDLIPAIENLVENGTPVVMTSQCLEGRVCDRVYDTGRDLLEAGVIEAGDTLPGTAYMKLSWAVANVEDVGETMRRSITGELTKQSRPWT